MRRGSLLALAALALAVLVPPALGVAPARGSPPADGEGRATLTVDSLSPAVLAPGGTVGARVTVTNTGTTPIEDAAVRLFVNRPRLDSREEVREWAGGESGPRTGSYLNEAPVDILPAGGSVTVDLGAPVDALEDPLPDDPGSWGPRGLTVDLVDSEFDRLAVQRPFVVWDPRTGPEDAGRVRTSVLVPLTAGAPDVATGLVPADDVVASTRNGGRLARVLRVASAPGVDWAVDPAVLSSADAAAATSAPVLSWLDQLTSAASGRDVLALPQADADVASLAHAGDASLYPLAVEQGRETLTELLGTPVRAEVTWPAGGSADAATVGLAAAGGSSTVVLAAGSQPVSADRDGEGGEDETAGTPETVTGRSTVATASGPLTGLLVDTGLSAALTDATEGRDAAVATSRFAADSAAVARQSGDALPHLLLALPRTWDPAPSGAAAALDQLRALPWLETAGVGALLETPPPDVPREELGTVEGSGDGGRAAGELPADTLLDVAGSVAQARSVASALTSPDAVLDGVETSAVAATSVAWRADVAAWERQTGVLTSGAGPIGNAVHVLEGSEINVVSARADLPVTVANDLEQAVEVVVGLVPRNQRLVADEDVPVTLAALSQQRVEVPVEAVASGDLDVVVEVRTPDGTLLGEPVTVPVRVRADWETRGVLALGAVLVLVLVAGVVRTIRRGGRRRRGVLDPLGEVASSDAASPTADASPEPPARRGQRETTR